MHKCVMVIGDVDTLMRPYQENNMGTCPPQYLKFLDISSEIKESWNKQREKYPDFDKFVEACYPGYIRKEDAIGYWENPNAQWDYYGLGGRYANVLKLKKESLDKGTSGNFVLPKKGFCDSALIEDIDFAGMKKRIQDEAEEHWGKWAPACSLVTPDSLPVGHISQSSPESADKAREEYTNQAWYKVWEKVKNKPTWMCPLAYFGTDKERFIQKQASTYITTYSILTEERWVDTKDLGQTDEEIGSVIDSLLLSLPTGTRISIVDCHS